MTDQIQLRPTSRQLDWKYCTDIERVAIVGSIFQFILDDLTEYLAGQWKWR